MDQNTLSVKDSDTLSFKEFILFSRAVIREYSKNKRLLITILLMGLIWGIAYKCLNEKTYDAELSFMINEDQNATSGLSSVIGQFGGLLSGAGDDINLQKILELGKSRHIAEKVFFNLVEIEGKKDFLANHLIREFERTGLWGKTPFYLQKHPLKGFLFSKHNVGDFSRLENMALIQLHALFLKMLTTQVSEKTSIMKISINSTNEILAYESGRRLFDEMSNFYIDKTIEKQKLTFSGLNDKADSLLALIHKKQYGLAGIKDNSRSTWLYREEVPKTILDQDIKVLQLVYAETMKNKEIASFALDHKTPFIQAIDLPILPLKCVQLGWIKSLFLGLIYSFLLASIIIFGRKIYRENGLSLY